MAKRHQDITFPNTEMVTKVVIVQLGSPETPKVSDVRKFLKEFLGDPRVVDINPTLWKIYEQYICAGFSLRYSGCAAMDIN